MNSYKYFGLFLFCITVFSLSSCSSAPELPSKWKTGDIVVDGLDNEWQQDLNYFEKEKIAVGIKNDMDNLYIAIKTIDRETQMKMVRGGMTVWFDPQGGNKKTFGIHFPLGASGLGGSPASPTHVKGSREEPDATNDYSVLEERFSKMLQNMEIIGPGPVDKEQIPLTSSFKSRGIKVSLRDTMGSLFYELIVPMKISPDKHLTIGADTGKFIGVGILTDDIRRSTVARERDEGAPNGGAGKPGMGGGGFGGGGGGRRGGGGGRSGQSPETSSPIEIWVKVKIASAH